MTSTKPKLSELLTQPGCEHNHHKQGTGHNKACQQQAKPGAAQGGCAFDGASITLVPITDAAHLVHGPIACAGNSWGGRGSLSSGPMLYKMGFTTDLSENDIIFGGEKKLYKAIQDIQERYNPAAVFVYSTCVTALIGDDLDAVCKTAAGQLNLPVIPVHAPGFSGSKNLGNRLAGEALLEHVIGTAEPEFTTPYDINLIGEYNIAGELWGVLPLFEKLGIRVLSKITGDARYKEVAYAHRAKLNVLICSKALINLATKLEQRYGIPYVEESFYGVEDMNRCLRDIAAHFGDTDLQARVEALIAEETAKLAVQLAPYRDRLQGKRVVLYTGGVKSWSIISAAQDLGIKVVATSTRKSTEADKARIRALLGPEGIMLDKGGAPDLLRVIEQTKADLLIAGGRNQYTALKARIPFLHVNQERHNPYSGYSGLLEMAKELDESLHSPVWAEVRRPAPWEAEERIESQIPSPAAPTPQTKVIARKKAIAVNPLKQSQPLGAALAFLGIQGAIPLFHGSQGCTAFAKVLLVGHFQEAIPLATTAMGEVSTVLGGGENVDAGLMTVIKKTKPELVGLFTTALTETRGDDMGGILREFHAAHPDVDTPIVFASTPDYSGSLEDGFAAAVTSLMRDLPEPGEINPKQVTLLASSAWGPGDVAEVKEIVEAFGLSPIVVPDLSTSLDGHLDDIDYYTTPTGGTPVADLRAVGRSAATLVLGHSLSPAAAVLTERFGTPAIAVDQLTGLGAVDRFLHTLSQLSGQPVPARYGRQRRQLQDAMLDTHFYFGRKRIAIALEPDLLYNIAWWLHSTGAEISAAVTATKSPLLKDLPTEKVYIGDFEDFAELGANADLWITNSKARPIARRLGIPLYLHGFPMLDQLGNTHRCSVGYRGTLNLLFDLGNRLLETEVDRVHQLVHQWRVNTPSPS
ncbi:bifunctional nitrogenase iron-molybdenum cofactor biosynthesis protein NifEN [Trichothermofontia sichuanensis B231]|uniref:bifunctional nitrogenase iron-molybdenum cofactor biosynthesis protein NifEN n=1 Tax=Trichothermofontia sichuanensis TaxID=3045816 RepID=UPI002246563A|nr:bifunctional nitrogenase iron-molybdenum cofactor biosynthesis protein NifEN [Trichothermofontia sichuanensis]UZQ54284.1 bifunctional nitrogenase iron-molybdenum cofactor biosynthesis protein NifEN [Trichothermofontia sichuanensis B231]